MASEMTDHQKPWPSNVLSEKNFGLILKTDHQQPWPSNVLSEKNFGLILKNKIAAIANHLKIIKML